jgi:predicted CoA-binding protein
MSIISDILRHNQTFAVVGVSQNREKYGYEIFKKLVTNGYRVYPINPKYEEIDGHRCYPSLDDLPEKPEVVVTVVPPSVTKKVVESCTRLDIRTVWMSPGSWSEQAVEMCEGQGIKEVHDVCLVFALRSLHGKR